MSLGDVMYKVKNYAAISNPITGHPLNAADTYFKNLYLDMLCSVALYNNPKSEEAVYFVTRIISGSGDAVGVKDHIKHSLIMSSDRIRDFVNIAKDKQFSEMFILDSLLTIWISGEPNKGQLEYVCEIANAMSLSVEKVKFIANLVSAILSQRNVGRLKIKTSLDYNDKKRLLEQVTCYLNLFSTISLDVIMAKNGDIVRFGKWNNKKLEWIVLSSDNTHLCLLAKDIICERCLCERAERFKNDWENTDLYAWLNLDFYSSAFNNEEKSLIVSHGEDKNYITLLTVEEVMMNINKDILSIGKTWWLRPSVGTSVAGGVAVAFAFYKAPVSSCFGVAVKPDGSIGVEKSLHDRLGVRPIIWIANNHI